VVLLRMLVYADARMADSKQDMNNGQTNGAKSAVFSQKSHQPTKPSKGNIALVRTKCHLN
jgi:hypothetical protein